MKAELVGEILTRLEPLYGVAEWKPRAEPLEELIHCILSQHTSDANSFRAYESLRKAFPTWQAIVKAPTEKVAEAIRSGGLANQKAPRIQAVLKAIYEARGAYDLNWLAELPTHEARQFLLSVKCHKILYTIVYNQRVVFSRCSIAS